MKKPKKTIITAKKIIANKEMILAYMRGEKTIEELNAEGIKLAMPL